MCYNRVINIIRDDLFLIYQGVIKMDLNNMEEVVIFINNEIQNGKTLRELERNEFKLNDRVMEKRLRRKGYRKIEGKYVLQDNTELTPKNNNNDNKETQNNTVLTQEEIKTLKEMAKNYKKIEPGIKLEGEITTRSFRTYKNVLENFANYCKENNLSQKDSIAAALINFLEN